MKLRLINICLLFVFFQVGMAQEITELHTTKKIKGKHVIKVEMNLKYLSGKKTLENSCAKFLFDDSKSMTLKDAADKYLHSLGEERENLKTERVYTFKLDISYDISNKLQSYIVTRKKLGGEFENKSWVLRQFRW